MKSKNDKNIQERKWKEWQWLEIRLTNLVAQLPNPGLTKNTQHSLLGAPTDASLSAWTRSNKKPDATKNALAPWQCGVAKHGLFSSSFLQPSSVSSLFLIECVSTNSTICSVYSQSDSLGLPPSALKVRMDQHQRTSVSAARFQS